MACYQNTCEMDMCNTGTCDIPTTTCDTGCVEPEPQPEVCTPEWDYVKKATVCYKTEPYECKVMGKKTIMVEVDQPYYKCVQKTKQVPCTTKKVIKEKVPCENTVMKPFQEPYTSYKCEQVKVPFKRKVCYQKEVPSTKTVCKPVKVPCKQTVMKQFPVTYTKKVQKPTLVDSQKPVQYKCKVPCQTTVKVPKQVCETKYKTVYKTETYKKPYECKIYEEPCILPNVEPETCPQPCAPEPTCDTGCEME